MIIEMMALGFAVWVLMRFAEGRERRELFSDRECGYCFHTIHWNGAHWVHDTGEVWIVAPPYRVPHAALPDRSRTW
jgi:hypothetical protein